MYWECLSDTKLQNPYLSLLKQTWMWTHCLLRSRGESALGSKEVWHLGGQAIERLKSLLEEVRSVGI